MRVIIDSDATNEIDDVWALALAFLSSDRFHVEGLVAANFDNARGGPESIADSAREMYKLLALAGRKDEVPVKLGSHPMQYQYQPSCSEGVDFIIEKALASTPEDPLWVIGLGASTNMASALLLEPGIVDRVVVFWHFRTKWPKLCHNFNVFNDTRAARILFHSPLSFVLFDTGTYLSCPMSFSEQFTDCGRLGKYLHEYRFRNAYYRDPEKGFFDLGDIAALLDPALASWEVVDCPDVEKNLDYSFRGTKGRILRCYDINREGTFDLFYKRLQARTNAGKYIKAVKRFADTVIEHGRDSYGDQHTPLFVDGLHAERLEPVIWKKDGESWVLCNFASQQPLLRTLKGLHTLTGQERYHQAASEATRYALKHLQSPNGLLYWGGHLAWDLDQDKPVGQGRGVHELKGHQPYYAFMWQMEPDATRKLLEAIWAGHVLDWQRLDYNRHASTEKPVLPQWDHVFADDIEVPFPAQGSNLSFVNVTPPLLHCSTMLGILDDHEQALIWTRRLAERWQQGKHTQTGLCGGQLSYREHDRAQDALGHVHPQINEAQIVASYHQTCRYHSLPLVQMQSEQPLRQAGGKSADLGQQLIDWAVEDLRIYARQCFDSSTGTFVAMQIDGTPLKWQQAKTDYYTPQSFAPRAGDGTLLWAYALAYRLSRDKLHWGMVRQLCKVMDLGDIGLPDGKQQALDLNTASRDWQQIYVLLELYHATGQPSLLKLGARIADNLLALQNRHGLFPRPGRAFARTGDDIPLALLHLAATLEGKAEQMPQARFDRRFFHCEFHGDLEEHQKKRADKRTYDNNVFYGS